MGHHISVDETLAHRLVFRNTQSFSPCEIPMSNSPAPKNSIQVLDRSAMLLDAIASYDEPASLKVLSADTDLHPSTAFRILRALTNVGFVERSVQGHYLLGRKLARLAQKVQQGGDIRREALPIMEVLRDRVGETVNLSVRAGDEVVYVERKASQKMIRVEQVIGSRAPLHVTGVGKLMLGTLGEDLSGPTRSVQGCPPLPNTPCRWMHCWPNPIRTWSKAMHLTTRRPRMAWAASVPLCMTPSARWPGVFPFRRPSSGAGMNGSPC